MPLYSEEDGVLNLYYQAYFDYIDGHLQSSLDLFCQAYASGVYACKDMIILLSSFLKERQLEEDKMFLLDIINTDSSDSASEEECSKELNLQFCLHSSESQAEVPLVPIKIEQKEFEVDFEVSKIKEHSLNKDSYELRKAQAREAKELKLQQYDLKAKEKLQRKVAEICGDGSLQPEVGSPRELEYIFDNSPAGKEVSEKFQELLSEDNSKLADILNDIKFGYKTNKVHPLTGPLKGYYARKISDYHRLVYRWIGPGQLEIRSCETHYGD